MDQRLNTFADVARKIGDARLATVLAELARNVETDIHNAKFIPLRSEVRNNLKLLRSEAQDFEKALSKISFLDLPLSATEIVPRAREATCNVIGLCDKALASISPKAGRPKAPGRVICALIVIEAWAFAHGKAPHGPNSPKALDACEDYWRACGGIPIGQGNPENWRATFKDALADHRAFRSLRSYIRDEISRGME